MFLFIIIGSGLVMVAFLQADPLPPENCTWKLPDCVRWRSDLHFENNCDFVMESGSEVVYSCAEECWKASGPTYLCLNDYCTRFREVCSQVRPTTTPMITTTPMTTKMMIPNTSTTFDATTAITPQGFKDENLSSTTTEGMDRNRGYDEVQIYIAVVLTLLLIAFCVYWVMWCRKKTPRKTTQLSGGSYALVPQEETVVTFRARENGEPHVTVTPGQSTAPPCLETQRDSELGQQTGKPKSSRSLLRSLSESNDEGDTCEDSHTSIIPELMKLITSLNGYLRRLQGNSSRHRRTSSSLSHVDERTDNENNGSRMIQGLSVLPADLETLQSGQLSGTMLTALLRVIHDKHCGADLKTKLVSFNQTFPAEPMSQDVILWPRMFPDHQPLGPHYYLVIVEMKVKQVHICDSLNNTALDTQSSMIEKEETLRGFKICTERLVAGRRYQGLSSGLCVVLYAEKYLTATAEGSYQPGQTEPYHLSLPVATDVAEHQQRLRNMID
ncbi:uncharacterized protein [Watersipora subatra]|uniref:uncharacterized protein n=1 Tax=Watersipora subatra TaxID=2589382 RepID=UPI00355C19CE